MGASVSYLLYLVKMLISVSIAAGFQLIFILGNHGDGGTLLSCRFI